MFGSWQLEVLIDFKYIGFMIKLEEEHLLNIERKDPSLQSEHNISLNTANSFQFFGYRGQRKGSE
jgi:hypothetical protein